EVAILNVAPEALGVELRHHGAEPQEAGSHVQPMASHQSEECREECASARSVAACDQAVELAQLEQQKHKTQQSRDQQCQLRPFLAALACSDTRHAAGEAGKQQACGLDGDTVRIENLPCRRAVGCCRRQYRIRGKQRGEHDDVGNEEDPEAVTDDDSFRGWATGSMPWGAGGCAPVAVTPVFIQDGGIHVVAPSCSAAARATRLARSSRATSSAGISNSTTSRQANTTNVA